MVEKMLWLERSDLPTNLDVNGQIYDINTDFRTWVRVECILQDKAIVDELKLPIICRTLGLFDFPIEEQEALWEAIMGFYFCGKKPKETFTNTNGKQGYRFDYDMDLIYAAFLQQYNINLLGAKLHWFEFMALFNGLTDETMLVRIIGYRTRDISKLKGEEKKQAQRLERYYRLPEQEGIEKEKSPEEIEAELLARLNE